MDDIPKPQAPSADDIQRMKPSAGVVLLGIPILSIAAVFAAYAWLFYNGFAGRAATGPEVAYSVQGCPDAAEVMQARVVQMGLASSAPTPADGGFRLSVSLPAVDTDVVAFGRVLGARGLYAMRAGEEVLATHEDIASAGVRLDMTMTPATLVVLKPDARDRVYSWMNRNPDERTSIDIDGVEVWSFGNRKTTMNGEFEIPPDADDDRARMELAAARGIVLNDGPLPCDVTVSPAGI